MIDENDEKIAFLSPTDISCDLLDEMFLDIPSVLCFPIADHDDEPSCKGDHVQ